MNAVLYIHGKGGSAAESARFGPLFPGHDVIGLDYRTFTPWETGKEIRAAAEELKTDHERVILIANIRSVSKTLFRHARESPGIPSVSFLIRDDFSSRRSIHNFMGCHAESEKAGERIAEPVHSSVRGPVVSANDAGG